MTADDGIDMTIRGGGTGRPPGLIDKFELVRELGEGGFGAVYLAKDTVAGIDVAIKGLPPEVKHNRAELEHIRENFALVHKLRHPNIVAVTDLHLAHDVFYADREVEDKLRVYERDTMVVMDYAPGVTLAQWRKQFPGGVVPPEKVLAVAGQIANALDYAHGCKILHRDIKPANVMVETAPDGTAKARILDFGLAAEIRSSMGRVSREIRDTSGTRPYMAPEQWKGEKQTAATDQYALAVLLYEMVCGEVPFASVFGCGDVAIMRLAVLSDAPEIPAHLPSGMREALAVALLKKPEERFASCGDFIAAASGGAAARATGEECGRDSVNARHKTATKIIARTRHFLRLSSQKTLVLPGGVEMEMIYVEPGNFTMGSPVSEEGRFDNEMPHEVEIVKPFWIGKYPVTQSQWEALVRANRPLFDKVRPRPWFSRNGIMSDRVRCMDTSDFPMEGISWKDCNALVEAMNRNSSGERTYFMPTEAQWEFAAKGGMNSKGYSFSGGNDMAGLGWCYENSGIPCLSGKNWIGSVFEKLFSCVYDNHIPHSVREKNVGNELGIVGMSGNVWEWCSDWYDKNYYKKSPAVDPQGPVSGSFRVLRGGSWDSNARCCRSAYRGSGNLDNRIPSRGFRLCCSVEPRGQSKEE